MLNQKILLPLITVSMAIGLGVFIGKQYFSGNNGYYDTVVKTYKLAPSRAKEAQDVIYEFFGNVDYARVRAFSGGQLLVSMPKLFEPSIDRVLNEFTDDNGQEQKRVRLDFWVLRASKEKIHRPQDLSKLKPVLDSIETIDGKHNFEVLEHLTSNTMSGNGATVKGWLASAKSKIHARDKSVSMNINLWSDFGKVEAQTMAKDNEFLVIGQSAIDPGPYNRLIKNRFDHMPTKTVSHVYYIVKPQIID